MKLLFSFSKPIGRAGFAVLFILSMLIYAAAFSYIPETNMLLIFVRIILPFGFLVYSISLYMRRLLDLGKKRSEIYLLLIPIYNIYILFLFFTRKGINFKSE